MMKIIIYTFQTHLNYLHHHAVQYMQLTVGSKINAGCLLFLDFRIKLQYIRKTPLFSSS